MTWKALLGSIVIIVILGLWITIQRKEIGGLRDDIALVRSQLVEAHRELEKVSQAHEVSERTIADAEKGKVGVAKIAKVAKEKVGGIRNDKTIVDKSSAMYDSMLTVYCTDSDDIACTSRRTAE